MGQKQQKDKQEKVSTFICKDSVFSPLVHPQKCEMPRATPFNPLTSFLIQIKTVAEIITLLPSCSPSLLHSQIFIATKKPSSVFLVCLFVCRGTMSAPPIRMTEISTASWRRAAAPSSQILKIPCCPTFLLRLHHALGFCCEEAGDSLTFTLPPSPSSHLSGI